MSRVAIVLACATLVSAGVPTASAQDTGMSFFITSEGTGNGADLGGLEGADAHCQQLAEAAGAGDKTWRAYLSTSDVDARDRIGAGPWYNAEGELIAQDLSQLHGDPNISQQTALTETGEIVKGRGDQPNMHDMLTGTNPDGTSVAGRTCDDWTNSGEGRAIVGHHDRVGLREDAPSRSWNSSHPTRGCSQEALRETGGNGLFYCFAEN